MKIQPKLPITAKLVPKSKNLLYLLEAAAVSRLNIGAFRVLQNSPDKYQSNNLTEYQKRKSYLERIFIELFGTAGYMVVLHGAQDFVSKLFYESNPDFIPPQLDQKMPLSELTHAQTSKVNDIMIDVFGSERNGGQKALHPEGIISRVLYGAEKTDAVTGNKFTQKATLSTLRERLSLALDKKTLKVVEEKFIKPSVEPYVRKLYKASSVSVLAGVVASAVFGGVVIQWINDNIFAPVFVPALVRLLYGKKDFAMGRQNNPNFQQTPGMSSEQTHNNKTGAANRPTAAQIAEGVPENAVPMETPADAGLPPNVKMFKVPGPPPPGVPANPLQPGGPQR